MLFYYLKRILHCMWICRLTSKCPCAKRTLRFKCNSLITALLITCMCVFGALELILYLNSKAGRDFIAYLQPPYRESIDRFDVGARTEALDNCSVANALRASVRVHCLLLVLDQRERLKAAHAASSWGTRCDRLHISEATSAERAYSRVYNEGFMQLDWLLHASVDSYFIMENLRHMLVGHAPSQPIYFSAHHRAYPYAHVGVRNTTDYVFSRAALQLLVARKCASNLDKCLAGIARGDSHQKLMPLEVPATMLPFTLRRAFWIWAYAYRGVYEGFSSISYPVCFHYVSAKQLHVLDYILYHWRVYGHGHVHGTPATNGLAQSLYQQVRILCLVFTYPKHRAKVMETISETWGRHCNKLIFFSNRTQRSRPNGHTVVALNISEGYDLLWGKTKAALEYVYKHHREQADWFFKVDDDTFAVMENMRYMLSAYQPQQAIYFGCKYKMHVQQGYMSGGAGYVMSDEALRRLVTYGFNSSGCNPNQEGVEDFEIGVCMAHCNVTAGDSRDQWGRHRFVPIPLQLFLIPGELNSFPWVWQYMFYNIREGIDCCSNYAISVHYVGVHQMRVFDFLLYKMRPYGIVNGYDPLPV